MLKLKKYVPENGYNYPCSSCRIFMLCSKCINDEGKIENEALKQLNNPSIMITEQERIREALYLASKCKKQFPNYRVVNERVTQHVLVGKNGQEIFSANSFWGYIGGLIVITIGSVILLAMIVLIVSGIGSLF